MKVDWQGEGKAWGGDAELVGGEPVSLDCGLVLRREMGDRVGDDAVVQVHTSRQIENHVLLCEYCMRTGAVTSQGIR